jgi:hypothetical protein
MRHHAALRKLNVLFHELRASLLDAVKQDECSIGISEIKDPQAVLPKLSPELPQFAFHLRGVGKWQVGSFSLQHFDERDEFGPMPCGQMG